MSILVAASATGARAACGVLPAVPWWGDLTHAKLKEYVERRHGGAWGPYIDKWDKERAKLKRVHARGSKVVFRKLGIKLEGGSLGEYIQQVEIRLEITRCLAQQDADFDNFATAAGGQPDARIEDTRALCGALPRVEWWGDLSHAKVKNYVDTKHHGDWAPYIGKWKAQHDTLKRAYARDSSIVFKDLGLTLKGPALADYVKQVEKRVEVVRCLARADGFDGLRPPSGDNLDN